MAKVKKVEFGIEITKPWSKEMYAHNEELADDLKDWLIDMWDEAYQLSKESYDDFLEDDQEGLEFGDSDPHNFNETMINICEAVTYYNFGGGYTVDDIADEVEKELMTAAFWRLKEIAEELEIDMVEEFGAGFVGLK
tara:strand:+ start:143 stop:553 length:411 start_codon:yes stop_codon:yes gene_type:complete